jgi:hypothetical protein
VASTAFFTAILMVQSNNKLSILMTKGVIMASSGNQGLGSDKMSDSKKHKIQSMGGKARSGSSSSNASGAAGKTEAAKRGGQNSRPNS